MGLLQDMETQPCETASLDSSLERLTELRHFLHQAVIRGILTEADLNLLVDFKLNGGTLAESNGCNGTSPNATRQKLKRLLSKLRRLAAKPK
ncbi:MAG: hypothetical protein JST77_18155 [Acidobacteria bacterium]|nr:hypothetical protein [Acidobacteriota bacterium]